MGYLLTKDLIAVMKWGAAAYLANSALIDMKPKTSGLRTTLRYRRKIREQERIIKVLGETIKDLKHKSYYPKTLEELEKEGQITPDVAKLVRELKGEIINGNRE